MSERDAEIDAIVQAHISSQRLRESCAAAITALVAKRAGEATTTERERCAKVLEQDVEVSEYKLKHGNLTLDQRNDLLDRQSHACAFIAAIKARPLPTPLAIRKGGR